VDGEARAGRALGQLLEGSRLPDPGLAGEEQPGRVPVARGLESALQEAERRLPPDEGPRGQALEEVPIHPAEPRAAARPASGASSGKTNGFYPAGGVREKREAREGGAEAKGAGCGDDLEKAACVG
jgi:hypothetical protein